MVNITPLTFVFSPMWNEEEKNEVEEKETKKKEDYEEKAKQRRSRSPFFFTFLDLSL